MCSGSTAPGNSTVPSGNNGIRSSTFAPCSAAPADVVVGCPRQRTTGPSSGVAPFQQRGGDDEEDGGPQAKDPVPLPGGEQVIGSLPRLRDQVTRLGRQIGVHMVAEAAGQQLG